MATKNEDPYVQEPPFGGCTDDAAAQGPDVQELPFSDCVYGRDGSAFDRQGLPDDGSAHVYGDGDDGCCYLEDCRDSCASIHEFLRLTDEMVETIIDLEDELVRWRQALIKYLPPGWAQGLQSDILNNLSRDFAGDPAYDFYVSTWRGLDPQQDEERSYRLFRLTRGIDETSITYL